MNKDLVYVFDKLTKTSGVLGEIQSGFNMSFVIDGTKDSTTIVVWSYSDAEIEPYSIILHKKTMTFWCVSHDKVERLQNDDSGFVYMHNLELSGAFEILNARDLTDSGFNDRTYTIEQFIRRLFRLTDVDNSLINFNADSNFLSKRVDFVKSFENYTLASALRELLDAYNMCPKLSFVYNYNSTTDVYRLINMVVIIIPKTGNRTRVHQISEFDDVRETKTIDKNSFGSTVVSNAENVISTQAKLYPSIGSVKLSSNEWDITRDNAILRLPTNAFKVNWISIGSSKNNVDGTFSIINYDTQQEVVFDNDVKNILNKYLNPSIKSSILFALDKLKEMLIEMATLYERPNFINAVNTQFEQAKEQMATKILKANTIKIFSGNNVNASTGDIIKGANIPYLAKIDTSDGEYVFREIGIFDKETRNMLKYPQQGLYWDRGSNLIEGFKGIASLTLPQSYAIVIDDGFSTDLQSNNTELIVISEEDCNLTLDLKDLYQLAIDFKDSQWRVNYIPMSDMKIKVDNQKDKKDIQLYNQNGKLTDSVALSKLLNSYSKEISSDTITRYMHYYSYSDVPQVGDIVVYNNQDYVINNMSMDFTQNETSVSDDFGYFIDCEITMSKWVSTKSLMVNPNSNIRDYGIPQKYNIKRKQLYRDYYELAYTIFDGANTDTPYLSYESALFFGHEYLAENSFICQMKIGYYNNINGQKYWYYQLETTTYVLDKMQYVLVDFQDNNIIGYSFMNMYSGIDLSKLFNPNVSINTPISYVDDNGQFESIELLFLTPDKLDENINEYKDFVGYGSDFTRIYNASCFIDNILFSFSEYNCDIIIEEDRYDKDAIEVPVFEYVLQIGDSEDVLIGDNVLQQHDGFVYFYFYNTGSNLNQNNVDSTNRFEKLPYQDTYRQYKSVDIAYDNADDPKLKVTLYGFTNYFMDTNNWTNDISPTAVPTNTDIAVFRRAFNPTTLESIIELMFIIKNVPASAVDNNQAINLMINHYKLK